VHLGSHVEIDIAAFEKDENLIAAPRAEGESSAVAVWATASPSVAVETTLPDAAEYAVRIYDVRRGRQLVAAVEIVGPANKDRPEHRGLFVGNCPALLQQGVAVSIVDLVTVRQFNLYCELLSFLGQSDPRFGNPGPPVYAASCRWVPGKTRAKLEAWSFELTVGQPLPSLPLWLSQDLVVSLDLEPSYEQACHDQWID
jgi:hypothetical protein